MQFDLKCNVILYFTYQIFVITIEYFVEYLYFADGEQNTVWEFFFRIFMRLVKRFDKFFFLGTIN